MKSLNRSYRYGRTSARAWIRDGGIPTFLPVPALFASVLVLSISSASWLASIGVLITYPILLFKVRSSKRSFYKLSTFVDPYVRLIHEIANNLGFISVVISIGTFLDKLKQERKEDKNEA
jgi:hypothetical protein